MVRVKIGYSKFHKLDVVADAYMWFFVHLFIFKIIIAICQYNM